LRRRFERANKRLSKRKLEPLPGGLTPHSLRRTYASFLFAIGETPPYVMAQMGHTTPTLTLAIYARQMDRRDAEPQRLRALVEGANGQPLENNNAQDASNGAALQAENGAKPPVKSAISPE
jgi:integrase